MRQHYRDSLINPPSASANPVEYYDTVRKQIEHEDSLVASRLSWLVSSQAFLFSAYAIVLKGLSSASPAEDKLAADRQDFIFHVIPILGMLSCLFIYLGLIGGVLAMRTLRRSLEHHAQQLNEVRPAIQGTRLTLTRAALSTRGAQKQIPISSNTNAFQIQFIANAASFHFAFIEQGGSSLYESFLPKVTSLEVLRIVGSIGGTEIQHFEAWQDKAGNAPEVRDNTGAVLFPALPTAPKLPNPANGTDPSQPNDTNQIMPAPCKFIRTNLPLCSVIRPTSTQLAGAVSTFTQFNNSGLFKGQSQAFLNQIFATAAAADAAGRSV